ncbi:MarR family winged helix-turn-helix transcriptional regulator [Actinoplanes friuliensis]|uniref:Regulatory protein MarR n=1 Tax=Actinoplanes friuliensis DSM 7358 TaxID=1246995 RepID=U5W7V4_9ACTN|nr:MarR family transcriptional regulator [Actinoplanes friuliensis]AGZ44040.1 regulatory protein MarR [Actinoplanes friuliensis DSM 7358]
MVVDAARLWTLNHRLLTVVLDSCTAELAELGLETKEFFVLAEVAASPYPAELAAKLVISKASMTGYVRNLVAKGFLRREIDDADLRRQRLILTPEGVTARDQALKALAAGFELRLARITPADRSELQRILLALLEEGAGHDLEHSGAR